MLQAAGHVAADASARRTSRCGRRRRLKPRRASISTKCVPLLRERASALAPGVLGAVARREVQRRRADASSSAWLAVAGVPEVPAGRSGDAEGARRCKSVADTRPTQAEARSALDSRREQAEAAGGIGVGTPAAHRSMRCRCHDRPTPRLAAAATQIDAVDRELLALLNRRAGWRSGRRDQEARRLGGVPPRTRSAGDRRPEGAEPGPAADRQRRADLARDHVGLPRARNADARGVSRPRRHLQRAGRARLLRRLRSCSVPCASIDEVFRTTSAGAADFGVVPVENSTEGVVARSLDLFLTTPLFIIGETSLLRAPQPAAQGELAGRHRGRVRASAGARAMPRLAVEPPAAGRAPARWRATPKARAWPALDPKLAGDRQRARRPASTACTSWRRRSRTTPHNRTRFAIVTHPERHPAPQAHRATTAPASSCRWSTGRARCTTCWCRSRSTACR